MIASPHRLRKHADYQRVYRAGRKQYTKNMAFFYALRTAPVSAQLQAKAGTPINQSGHPLPGGSPVPAALAPAINDNPAMRSLAGAGPRIGLTVPKALGNAVVRNRIKRRMREAVRHTLPMLGAPVDLVLHPRRIVMNMDFSQLQREVAGVFRTVETACQRTARTTSAPKGASA